VRHIYLTSVDAEAREDMVAKIEAQDQFFLASFAVRDASTSPLEMQRFSVPSEPSASSWCYRSREESPEGRRRRITAPTFPSLRPPVLCFRIFLRGQVHRKLAMAHAVQAWVTVAREVCCVEEARIVN
jgi:hypothetical protein